MPSLFQFRRLGRRAWCEAQRLNTRISHYVSSRLRVEVGIVCQESRLAPANSSTVANFLKHPESRNSPRLKNDRKHLDCTPATRDPLEYGSCPSAVHLGRCLGQFALLLVDGGIVLSGSEFPNSVKAECN